MRIPCSTLRREIDRYVLGCLEAATPPRVSELAQQLGTHPVSLARRAAKCGLPELRQMIASARADFLMQLLACTSLGVGTVASHFGYASVNSLDRFCRSHFQQTPTTLKAQIQMQIYRCGGSYPRGVSKCPLLELSRRLRLPRKEVL